MVKESDKEIKTRIEQLRFLRADDPESFGAAKFDGCFPRVETCDDFSQQIRAFLCPEGKPMGI
jgi:hypothetical protein